MLQKVLILLMVLSSVAGGIKVVSNIVTGKAPCLFQCVGLVQPVWCPFYSDAQYIKARVDISECGYIGKPIINANLDTKDYRYKTYDEVYTVSNKEFVYYVFYSFYEDTLGKANSEWKVSWMATGYVC